MNSKWDIRFLLLAKHVAGWSKDPSTQVGAVIVRPDRTVASLGFNGFPKGVRDDPEMYEDRETKYERIIHADMNALLFLKEPGKGMTMYTWPGPPCMRCAVHIVQAEISEIVSVPNQNDRWTKSVADAERIFKEAGISMIYVDLRL